MYRNPEQLYNEYVKNHDSLDIKLLYIYENTKVWFKDNLNELCQAIFVLSDTLKNVESLVKALRDAIDQHDIKLEDVLKLSDNTIWTTDLEERIIFEVYKYYTK